MIEAKGKETIHENIDREVVVRTLGAGRGVGLEVSGCMVELSPEKARGYADLLRACADRAEGRA
jgi:hypothetical protein